MPRPHRAPTTYWDIVEPDFHVRFNDMMMIWRQNTESGYQPTLFLPVKARVLGAVATLSELGNGNDPWSRPVTRETHLSQGFVVHTLHLLQDSGLLTSYRKESEGPHNIDHIVYKITTIGEAIARPLLAVEQLREVRENLTAVNGAV